RASVETREQAINLGLIHGSRTKLRPVQQGGHSPRRLLQRFCRQFCRLFAGTAEGGNDPLDAPLDRLPRADPLADSLARDVLKAARFVDASRAFLQARSSRTAQLLANSVERLATLEDSRNVSALNGLTM